MIALWILLGVVVYLFVGIVTVAVMVHLGITTWNGIYDEPDDALFAVVFSVIWPLVWLCAICLTGVRLVLKVIGKKKEEDND